MEPGNDYQFWLKSLLFGAGIIFLMVVFPLAVFADTGTPSDASRETGQVYEDAYQEAYEEAYGVFMEDMYQMYADTGAEGIISEDLYLTISECRDFLESCASLLVFCNMLLAVLVGCVCASILSHYLRVFK